MLAVNAVYASTSASDFFFFFFAEVRVSSLRPNRGHTEATMVAKKGGRIWQKSGEIRMNHRMIQISFRAIQTHDAMVMQPSLDG